MYEIANHAAKELLCRQNMGINCDCDSFIEYCKICWPDGFKSKEVDKVNEEKCNNCNEGEHCHLHIPLAYLPKGVQIYFDDNIKPIYARLHQLEGLSEHIDILRAFEKECIDHDERIHDLENIQAEPRLIKLEEKSEDLQDEIDGTDINLSEEIINNLNIEERLEKLENRCADFNIRNDKFYDEMHRFMSDLLIRIEKLEHDHALIDVQSLPNQMRDMNKGCSRLEAQILHLNAIVLYRLDQLEESELHFRGFFEGIDDRFEKLEDSEPHDALKKLMGRSKPHPSTPETKY